MTQDFPMQPFGKLTKGAQFYDAQTGEYYEKGEGSEAKCLSAEEAPRARNIGGRSYFEDFWLVKVE